MDPDQLASSELQKPADLGPTMFSKRIIPGSTGLRLSFYLLVNKIYLHTVLIIQLVGKYSF